MNLTLEQTWDRCLAMWRWVVAQTKRRPDVDIAILKKEWLAKHRPADSPLSDCYFCEYAAMRSYLTSSRCRWCPGRLVSPRFHCAVKRYHWYGRPGSFLCEIEELNIRRKRKGARKKP